MQAQVTKSSVSDTFAPCQCDRRIAKHGGGITSGNGKQARQADHGGAAAQQLAFACEPIGAGVGRDLLLPSAVGGVGATPGLAVRVDAVE